MSVFKKIKFENLKTLDISYNQTKNEENAEIISYLKVKPQEKRIII